MNHVVEVRYSGGDWADLAADMRSWLGRRQIETDEFEHSVLGRGIEVVSRQMSRSEVIRYLCGFSEVM